MKLAGFCTLVLVLSGSLHAKEVYLGECWLVERFVRASIQSDDAFKHLHLGLGKAVDVIRGNKADRITIYSEEDLQRFHNYYIKPRQENRLRDYHQGEVPAVILMSGNEEAEKALIRYEDLFTRWLPPITFEGLQFDLYKGGPETFPISSQKLYGTQDTLLNPIQILFRDRLIQPGRYDFDYYAKVFLRAHQVGEEGPFGIQEIRAAHHNLLQQIPSLGQQFARSLTFSFSRPEFNVFIEKAMGIYFSRLPAKLMSRIAEELMLTIDPIERDLQKFKVIAKFLGPNLLKFLQMVARDPAIDSEEARQALIALEENLVVGNLDVLIKTLSHTQFQGHSITKIDPFPLSAGTVAAIFNATAKAENSQTEKPMILRTIKREIPALVEMEKPILAEIKTQILNDPYFSADGRDPYEFIFYLEASQFMVDSELNSANTVKAQNGASTRYAFKTEEEIDGRKYHFELSVPKAYPSNDPSIFLMEKVNGQSLTSFLDRERSALKRMVEIAATRWAVETFFGDGYSHGDLHGGNLKFELDGDQVRGHVLDFGIFTYLDKNTRLQMAALAIAAELDDYEVVARMMLQLSKKAVPDQVLKEMSRQVHKSGSEWMEFANSYGLKFTQDQMQVARATRTMENVLRDAGSNENLIGLLAANTSDRLFLQQVFQIVSVLTMPELLRLKMAAGKSPKIENLLENVLDQAGPIGMLARLAGGFLGELGTRANKGASAAAPTPNHSCSLSLGSTVQDGKIGAP